MSTRLPTVSSYGQYSSENYGVNTLCVSFDAFDLYYSYRTIVAYRALGEGVVVRQNEWGPTTGKHLRWIDGRSGRRANDERIPGPEFEEQVAALLKRHNLLDC